MNYRQVEERRERQELIERVKANRERGMSETAIRKELYGTFLNHCGFDALIHKGLKTIVDDLTKRDYE